MFIFYVQRAAYGVRFLPPLPLAYVHGSAHCKFDVVAGVLLLHVLLLMLFPHVVAGVNVVLLVLDSSLSS